MSNHFSFYIKLFFSFKYIVVLTAAFFLFSKCYCQCPDGKNVYNNITETENNNSFDGAKKLNTFYAIKGELDECKATEDSVYAELLEHISIYEFQVKNYSVALSYALQALEINNTGKRNCSKFSGIKNYSIVAHYYDQLLLFNKALLYYDSAIIAAKNFPAAINYVLDARLYKSYVYFRAGDFQKGAEESTIGLSLSINNKDTISFIRFLNQRAQSLFFQNKLQQANDDLESAIQLATKLQQPFQLASAYKMKGFIYAGMQDFTSAEIFFKKSIEERLLSKRYEVVASDYNDFGNFYRDSTRFYDRAKNCYFKAIEYAQKNADSVRLGMITVNLAKMFFYKQNYKEAELYYLKQMQFLKLSVNNNFLSNPTLQATNLIGNKQIIITLFQDKTSLLLNEYRKNKLNTYLSATLETARLTDSIITQTRHEQTGEQSKLYWRSRTRDFYANSIEACYLADDAAAAFFFLEKSRAVLLNDKLNEIDASAHLPAAEIAKQEMLQISILEQEQKLSLMHESSPGYANLQIKFLHTKEDFQQYIKSLDQKYPLYYQYKYDDEVPGLKDFQQYLAKNNQSFVHYFLGDTTTYILAITPEKTIFKRLSQNQFNKVQLNEFLQFCANKEMLNNHYDSFASLSNSIYTQIFEPLQLSKGRTIICSDNIVIPFEALCTDINGKNFLLNDYIFSYVYSARFLIKQFNNPVAKGNFLGFAPVSFNDALKVAELTNAAAALKSSSSFYTNDKLFTHENATRKNFFNYAASYSIINIFSHAKADTTNSEPVLYMQDSTIHLSELQLLNNPATKFVLLSACQTNVGKAATGEGIYSLARGFAIAGIPSVAATLWNADEQTIYSISEKFNQYLSEGMTKDEALQKAKLYFIHNNNSDKLLPYYWANMIVIGNTDAVKLEALRNNSYLWFMATGIAIIIIIIVVFRVKYFKK